MPNFSDAELRAIIKKLGLDPNATTHNAAAIIEKNDRGTYNIMTVSTAALEDREGETFTVKAIDYDIAEAEKYGDYPEYRVFHSKHLGIGQVDSMKRVGIFAIDQGESYDDPFSLAICEKMLVNNNGKWRVSRGFRVKELSGACPICSDSLLISQKHMIAGFRCPGCSSVHLRFKGVLEGIRFRKARTFDVTVTDVPAVPYTGALAWRDNVDSGGLSMTKEELKERLLKAQIPEDAIDDRLKELTDKQLKEFDDIPMAEVLKEFVEDEDDGDAVVVDFDDMVNSFKEVVTDVVEKVVNEALEGFQVEVDGLEDLSVNMKEVPVLQEIKEHVMALEEKMVMLLESDEDRLKELLADTPRAGRVRIVKGGKGKKPKFWESDDDEEDDEEDDEDEDEEKEHLASWIKSLAPAPDTSDQIVTSDGEKFDSMTAMVHNNPSE
jgi:hypothetical protein